MFGTRDFTYIDDIVEGIVRILDKAASPDPRWKSGKRDPATSSALKTTLRAKT